MIHPDKIGNLNRAFTYDDLSRLTHTDQYVNGERVRQNVERHLSYDRNGNLQRIIRYEGGKEQCNMKYQYQGNHLYRYMADDLVDVDFGADTVTMLPAVQRFENLKPWLALHEYDANGNVTKDWERGLEMWYNSLNLLEYASDSDGNAINYCYLADGTKLAATDADDCGLLYRGSFTYRVDADANRVFESTPFGGGRIVGTTDNETEARYFVTDHLGSVRVVANSGNEILERNDYQPFGKRWPTSSMPVSDNRDRFNGKEDQSFAGLPFLDYGTRMYDRERGRWLSQDPKAEEYINVSPYVFCANNPIKYIDPNGKEIIITMENDVLKIHYIGKVFNDSMQNYSIAQLQAFADVFKSQIEAAWSGTFDGLTVETTVELEVAESVDEFEENDHVIYIGEDLYMNKYDTEDQESGHHTANGKGSVGGKYMAVNNIILDNPKIATQDGGRTVAHEFGHNLGLAHPIKSLSNNPEYNGNIMWQWNHPKAGKSPNKAQLLHIYNNPTSYNNHSNIYPKYKR